MISHFINRCSSYLPATGLVLLSFLFVVPTVYAYVDQQPPGNDYGGMNRSGNSVCGGWNFGPNCGTGYPSVSTSPMVINLTADRTAVFVGQPVNMTWSVSHGVCYTTGGFGGWPAGSAGLYLWLNSYSVKYSQNGSGSFSTNTPGTYLFTYVCNGQNSTGSTALQSRAVVVTVVPLPLPTCSLLATTVGQTTTLRWISNNTVGSGTIVNNLDATVWTVDPRNISGTRQVSPTQTTNYTMQVSNASGQTANCSRTVTVAALPATATITGTSCTIQVGRGTCTSQVTWSINNATNPNVRNVSQNTYANSANGTDVNMFIPFGVNNVLEARNGTTVLARAIVRAQCVVGSSWNGTMCALPTPTPVTATLNGVGCSIAANQSSCNGTFTWSTNAATPRVVNHSLPLATQLYSTLSSGSNQSRPIRYGNNTVALFSGATLLRSVTVNARCVVNTTWNGSVCLSGTTTSVISPTITADSSIIRVGDVVDITWDPGSYTDCTLSTNLNGDPRMVGTDSVQPNSRSTYTISCGTTSATATSDTVTVTVLPTVYES